MKKIFIISIILQLFSITSCKKKLHNNNTITPNQLENHVKNGDKKYNISGEKNLNDESESQSYKDFEESVYNNDQPQKNGDYESNNDFEYSEYWRKEAHKNSKRYIIEILKKNRPYCKMVGQGYYQPNLVKYLGRKSYLVTVLCRYDCNQDYINEVYFWVEAYYLGNNHWSMGIVKQKFKD